MERGLACAVVVIDLHDQMLVLHVNGHASARQAIDLGVHDPGAALDENGGRKAVSGTGAQKYEAIKCLFQKIHDDSFMTSICPLNFGSWCLCPPNGGLTGSPPNPGIADDFRCPDFLNGEYCQILWEYDFYRKPAQQILSRGNEFFHKIFDTRMRELPGTRVKNQK